MTISSTRSPGRPRHWSRSLTVHAVVVVALGLAAALLWTAGLIGAGHTVAGLLSFLGLPWSFFALILPFPWDTMGYVTYALLETGAAGCNVLVHWGVLAVVRERRRGQVGAARGDRAAATGQAVHVFSPLLLVSGCVLLGAAIWGAWLGWDTSYYEIPGQSGLHGPYTPAQVAACAATVGLVTALLVTARVNPVIAAGGVSAGFWTSWTINAAVLDDSGLFVIGAVLLAFGLVIGTAVAAAIGYLARRPSAAWRARRRVLST